MSPLYLYDYVRAGKYEQRAATHKKSHSIALACHGLKIGGWKKKQRQGSTG